MKTKISKVPLLISMGGVLCCAPLLLSAAEVSATVSAPVPVAPAPESNPVAVSPPVSASVNVTDSAAPLPYGVADIVKLTRAQVSEDVILSYVQNSKSAFSVTPDDIVRLRNEGVSDRVINSMLDHHTKVMNSLPPQGVPASTSVYADNNVNAGTANTQPQQPPTTSVADTEYGTEILLLERIQKVLDEAADGQTGTVKMERGMIDELRSEVTQVRLALKAKTVRGS